MAFARGRFDQLHKGRTLARALTTASYPPLPRIIGIGNGLTNSSTATRPAKAAVPYGEFSAWRTYDKGSEDLNDDNEGLEVKDTGKGERNVGAIEPEMAEDPSKEPGSPKLGSDSPPNSSSRGKNNSSHSNSNSDPKQSANLTDNAVLSLLMAALYLLAGPLAVILLLCDFAWELGRYGSRTNQAESSRGNDNPSSCHQDSDSARPIRWTAPTPLFLYLTVLYLPLQPLVLVWLILDILNAWEERTHRIRMVMVEHNSPKLGSDVPVNGWSSSGHHDSDSTRPFRLTDRAPLYLLLTVLSPPARPFVVVLLMLEMLRAWEERT